jgi:hypothetical protein
MGKYKRMRKTALLQAGSVINRPPGSVIQDYGFADPDPEKNIYGTAHCFNFNGS